MVRVPIVLFENYLLIVITVDGCVCLVISKWLTSENVKKLFGFIYGSLEYSVNEIFI